MRLVAGLVADDLEGFCSGFLHCRAPELLADSALCEGKHETRVGRSIFYIGPLVNRDGNIAEGYGFNGWFSGCWHALFVAKVLRKSIKTAYAFTEAIREMGSIPATRSVVDYQALQIRISGAKFGATYQQQGDLNSTGPKSPEAGSPR